MQNTRYLVSVLGYRISATDSSMTLCSALAELQEDFQHILSVIHGNDGSVLIWPDKRLSPKGRRLLDASMNYYFGKYFETCAIKPDLI